MKKFPFLSSYVCMGVSSPHLRRALDTVFVHPTRASLGYDLRNKMPQLAILLSFRYFCEMILKLTTYLSVVSARPSQISSIFSRCFLQWACRVDGPDLAFLYVHLCIDLSAFTKFGMSKQQDSYSIYDILRTNIKVATAAKKLLAEALMPPCRLIPQNKYTLSN